MEYGYKPTTTGRAIMTACMALGAPLELTRIAVGDGRLPEGANMADVHELIHYVAEGAIGDRRHEKDLLYLTVQYRNDVKDASHKTFLLSEFIVYAKHPVTGQDESLLYATLGDYPQSVPPYTIGMPPSIWNFPLTIVVSDEIFVSFSAPAGLVTHEELIKLLNNRAAGAAKVDITIPATGWAEGQDTQSAYPLHLDITSTDITEAMIPLITVLPESLQTAAACGLCPASQTLPGALRLYTKRRPSAAIAASLTLLDTERRHSGLAGSAATAQFDVSLPTTGWEADNDTNGEYGFHLDIPNEAIEDSLIPILTVVPEHLAAAGDCQLSPYARTLAGALRVYTKRVPTSTISASLALLGTSQSINEYKIELPVASATTLGGVKIQEGSGLIVDSSGNLTIDAAVEQETEEIYNTAKPTTDSK